MLLADNGIALAAGMDVEIEWMLERPETRDTIASGVGNTWGAVFVDGIAYRNDGPDIQRVPADRRPRMWPFQTSGAGVVASDMMLPGNGLYQIDGTGVLILPGTTAGGYRSSGQTGAAITGIVSAYLVVIHRADALSNATISIETTKGAGTGAFFATGQALSQTVPGTLFANFGEQFREEMGLNRPSFGASGQAQDAFELSALSAGMGGDGPWDGTTFWLEGRQFRIVNAAGASVECIWFGIVFVLDSGTYEWPAIGASFVGRAAGQIASLLPQDEVSGATLLREIALWQGVDDQVNLADIAAAEALATIDGWDGAGQLGIVVRDSIRYLELIQKIADQTQLVVWLEGLLVAGVPTVQLRCRYRRTAAAIVAGSPGRVVVWSRGGPCDLLHLPRVSLALDDVHTRVALRYNISDARGPLGSQDFTATARELELGIVVDVRMELDAITGDAAAILCRTSDLDWHAPYPSMDIELDARVTGDLTLMDLLSVETFGAGAEGAHLQVLELTFDPADEWDSINLRAWDDAPAAAGSGFGSGFSSGFGGS